LARTIGLCRRSNSANAASSWRAANRTSNALSFKADAGSMR
jgi:hypothetical protein